MKRQFTVLFGFTIALFVTLPVLPPPPSTAQGAPLVLWHHYPDGRGDLLASLADEYTTETSVEIAVQHYPDYPRQHNAILSALVNGGLPNLALVRSHDAALYALGNRVLDLNLLLDERIDSAAFYPAMWMQDELNGQRLGLPLGRSFEALYINQDALAELGFDAPPANLDEFSDMACAFAEAEGWSRYEGVNLVGYELSLDASLLIAMAQPVTFYDATDGFTFDDLGWTDLITRLQSLLTNGCIRLTLNEETGRQSRFAAGQALFYTASSSALPYLDQAIRDFFAVPFTLKVHPIPAHNGPVVNLYGPSLTIFDLDAVQNETAYDFAAWLMDPDRMTAWADANYLIPARQQLPVAFGDPDLINTATWITEPTLAGYTLVRDELVFVMRRILAGGDALTDLNNLTVLANSIRDAFMVE